LKKVLFSLYPDHKGDGKSWFRVAFTPAELNAPRKSLRKKLSQKELF
jgi:hypothetical protein